MALNLVPRQLQQASKSDTVHLFRVRGNGLVTLFPNLEVEAFKNPKVRQAMQYRRAPGRDRQAGLSRLRLPDQEHRHVLRARLHRTNTGRPRTTSRRPRNCSRRPGTETASATELYYSSESTTLATLAPIIQSSFAQIGIEAKLVSRPASELVTRAFGQEGHPALSDRLGDERRSRHLQRRRPVPDRRLRQHQPLQQQRLSTPRTRTASRAPTSRPAGPPSTPSSQCRAEDPADRRPRLGSRPS